MTTLTNTARGRQLVIERLAPEGQRPLGSFGDNVIVPTPLIEQWEEALQLPNGSNLAKVSRGIAQFIRENELDRESLAHEVTDALFGAPGMDPLVLSTILDELGLEPPP